MAIWKDSQNMLHDDMDGAALSLPSWPQGMMQISDDEANGIRASQSAPTPTIQEQIAAIEAQFTTTLQMRVSLQEPNAITQVQGMYAQIAALKQQL